MGSAFAIGAAAVATAAEGRRVAVGLATSEALACSELLQQEDLQMVAAVADVLAEPDVHVYAEDAAAYRAGDVRFES
jgi:hypothetical protein